MNLKICFLSLAMFLAVEVHAGNLKNIPKTLECQMDISSTATTKIEFHTPLGDECKTVGLDFPPGNSECVCRVGSNWIYPVTIGQVSYQFYASVDAGSNLKTCPNEVDLTTDDFSIDAHIQANAGEGWYGTTLTIHGQNALLGIGLDGGTTGSPCKVTSTF